MFRKAGKTKEQLSCPPRADVDFTGTWSEKLAWMKPPPGATDGLDLKVVVRDANASGFLRRAGDWVEAKHGKFRMSQLEQTLVVCSSTAAPVSTACGSRRGTSTCCASPRTKRY